MTLPECEQLELKLDAGVLHVTLNRPEVRNALSQQMGAELVATFEAIRGDRAVRAVVLRGAGGNFCAGGDIKDMARVRQALAKAGPGEDPVAEFSSGFGKMLWTINRAPQAVVTVLEGAVLGGGFGLCCASDVAIAHANAKFGLPETSIGIPPSQIAPFVVERIGITQARRLGVCGGRFDGAEALRLGLVHFCEPDDAGVESQLQDVIARIQQCAPGANAETKRIMQEVHRINEDALVETAAKQFSACLLSEEGIEGTMSFIEKRKPKWAE